MQMFDKQIQVRMGQANVRRWSDDILPLLGQEEDVLGVESFATHHLPLSRGADGVQEVPRQGGRLREGGLPALATRRAPWTSRSS